MTSIVAQVSLALALLFAILTIGVGIRAGRHASSQLANISRNGVYVVFGCVAVTSTLLIHAFVTHDFSIQYVQHYSDSRMPLGYLLAAFWGGQAGSLLLWATVLTLFSAMAVYFARDESPELMAWVHVVLMTIATFFLGLLVFVSNPFDSFAIIDAPANGGGLNPVLQNYWMAIHPPSLLTGYASVGIPFAFGTAALITGRLGSHWIRLTRRWLLVSFLFLTLGNLLGARWAYEELGWGGYWAWDPVENAAILPWFTATALLHSVVVQEHRGMLKRWNMFLLQLTFFLTIFGTFLTRSGMIVSVHSFAESSIGPFFLGALIALAIGSTVLLAKRWASLASKRRLESYFSKEAVFLLNNWVLLAAMFVVLWGTISPKITEIFTGQASALGAPWFNRFAVPIGLTLLLLMSVGMLIAWRRATVSNLRRNFMKPLVISAVISPLICAGYYYLRLRALQPNFRVSSLIWAILAVELCTFSAVVIAIEFRRGIRSRRRKQGGSVFSAFLELLGKHRRRYGGYLVHVGIVLIIFGISGNAFKVSQSVSLRIDESVELGDYLLTFRGMEQNRRPDRVEMFAELDIRRCSRTAEGLDSNDCGEVSSIRPARFDYTDYTIMDRPDPMKVTSEIAISTGPLEDVYISIAGLAGEDAAAFEMFVNPFVLWLWLGGLMAVFSTVICFWPERVRVRDEVRAMRFRRFFDATAMWFLACLPVAIMLGGPDSAFAQAEAVEQTVVEGLRTEGSDNMFLYSQIRCRCETCGGQALSGCQPVCGEGLEDRTRIDAMLADGMSTDEVLTAWEREYGSNILAVPDRPMVVWVVPLAGLIFGLLAVYFVVKGLRSTGSLATATATGRSSPFSQEPKQGKSAPSNDQYLEQLADELRDLD